MAIVDQPLFGEEARGRIKNTLVFFKRFANLGYDDEDPGERFIVNSLRAYRQAHSPLRKQWKDFFSDQVAAWYALTEEEREAYNALATGLQTGYNYFLQETMTVAPPPPVCPPEWWPYEASMHVLEPNLSLDVLDFPPTISLNDYFYLPVEHTPSNLSPSLTTSFQVLP
jgi:hypothetical protein